MLAIIFVVLMLFWLFGGGFLAYGRPEADRRYAFGSYILPWICVAILGWAMFNGVDLTRVPAR